MSSTNLLKNLVGWMMTRAERARLRQSLLALSDRQLADKGFSRERLDEGVAAWPWRTPNLEPEPALRMGRACAEREAVAELQGYSDLELADLGLSRGGIPEAVRYGRPGIERPEQRQRAA